MSLQAWAGWRWHQARHWLRCRWGAPAVILMYHRVTELANDPHLLAVAPEHFGQQLEAIGAIGVPLRLSELVQALQQGRVPPRAVAVTFDDGYADNLHNAKPLLARHGVPATVFVTAGQVGRQREFWWDELDRLLLQPGVLPPVLRLSVSGGMREWRLDAAETYTEQDHRRDRHWHIERREDPGPRQRLFRALFELIYALPSEQKWRVLAEVAARASVASMARPSHRTLTPEELARLAGDGLVDIGAHTMTHPVLATLPPADQRQEIRESKACLEAILGRPVVSFAYPHGSSTPEAVASLAQAGYSYACGSRAEAVFQGADLFHLPRLVVRNWDGDAFARWLRWWVGA
jgi:peptidoglycan/xylan/chitin deacetylase (PgdA/CDA1 family)